MPIYTLTKLKKAYSKHLGKDFMNVELIDKMGTDLSVVNAARVSYSKTKDVFDGKDEKLINSTTKSLSLTASRLLK